MLLCLCLVSSLSSQLPWTATQQAEDDFACDGSGYLFYGDNALVVAGSQQNVSRASQKSIAQCIASISKPAGQDQALQTINRLMSILQKKSSTTSESYLALVSIGEIGRLVDTKTYKKLFETLVSFLSSNDEDIKSAAVLAVGGVSSGNLATYLPPLFSQIKKEVCPWSFPSSQQEYARLRRCVFHNDSAQKLWSGCPACGGCMSFRCLQIRSFLK